MNIGNLFFNKFAAKPQAASQTPQTNNKPSLDSIYANQNDGAELNWDDEIFQKLYPNDNGGLMG